ncbi:LEA type 2 family protein [Pontibacter korlensis]|uniref:Water stress and hypersensitive response domain-containing protein n=1 Tax=Pontibacter korlensis TaxID=400092 RepID=A0A0E3ZF63_9BACT|nr:LEA type 2 family protein [Pontibacter korlensis]AKD04120.1 hypothetical protein PKOR_14740 [Pontibacter korlensis]
MKRALSVVAILVGVFILLAVLSFLLVPREKLISYLAPTIDNMRITDARIEEERATIQVQLDVSSKLVSVFIDSLAYDMQLYGTSVSKGQKGFDKDSKKGRTQTLTIPVSMNHNTTRELVRRQVKEDAPVQAHIKAFADVPLFGRQEFDINEELDMVIPALPGMEVTGIKVQDFGLDSMGMIMTMKIDNPNEFAFDIKDMKMDLQLKDYMTSVGNTQETKFIKAHDVTEIQMPVLSDTKKPLKAAFDVITGDTEWPYTMKSYMVIEPRSEVVGTVEINSTKTGTVDIVKQVKNMKEEKEKKEEQQEE